MLHSGTTTRRFVGHTKDMLSVVFSADNSQIVSAAHDHTIKLWNTLGVCKYTIQVGCIRINFYCQKKVHLYTITAFMCGGAKAIDSIKGLYALDCMDIFWVGWGGPMASYRGVWSPILIRVCLL